MDTEELHGRFIYYPVDTEKRQKDHGFVRMSLEDVAHKLNETLPEGREKSLVMTKLEEAMFWANAAIARQTSE